MKRSDRHLLIAFPILILIGLLEISLVIHKAFVEVNEEGTEAAAAMVM